MKTKKNKPKEKYIITPIVKVVCPKCGKELKGTAEDLKSPAVWECGCPKEKIFTKKN